MAFRSTGSRLMAGVSRSKDFRLTLEQLRIYKKVSFLGWLVANFLSVTNWQRAVWGLRNHGGLGILWFAIGSHQYSFCALLFVLHDALRNSIIRFPQIAATEKQSKSVCWCHDETDQCPRSLRSKSCRSFEFERKNLQMRYNASINNRWSSTHLIIFVFCQLDNPWAYLIHNFLLQWK